VPTGADYQSGISSGQQFGVIEVTGRIFNGSQDILALQIRIILEDLLEAGTRTNPDARASSALFVVDGDSPQ